MHQMLTDQLADQLTRILSQAPPSVGVRVSHQWTTGEIALIRLEFITEMTDELLAKLRG